MHVVEEKLSRRGVGPLSAAYSSKAKLNNADASVRGKILSLLDCALRRWGACVVVLVAD